MRNRYAPIKNMRQFAFVFEDIKRTWLYYLRFFVQIAAALIVVGFSASLLLSFAEFRGKFSRFNDLSLAYITRNNTSDAAFHARCRDATFADRLLNYTISSIQTTASSFVPIEAQVCPFL